MSVGSPSRRADTTILWEVFEIGLHELCVAMNIIDKDADVDVALSTKQTGIVVTVKQTQVKPR